MECPISINNCLKFNYFGILLQSCDDFGINEAINMSTNDCVDDMEEFCNTVDQTKVKEWFTPEQCKKIGTMTETKLGKISMCTCTSDLCNTAELKKPGSTAETNTAKRKTPALYITAFIQMYLLILLLSYTT